ncbi:hypothetical protein J416_11657 [Gracilibacillus halophilus YIM-C55.5]|uniref:Uncharacterized protein n=1 Tax=Gracilibacillus halophilus YIM-C55.5 TaxID=1308866 RepID=N4WJD7_9BACI|nr:hypothetical protein [Gracilibacillus halophilus]ENH96272.1 hypothetical protein J416_11657 [Gracilibacillus halophilus YIM-C55.5]
MNHFVKLLKNLHEHSSVKVQLTLPCQRSIVLEHAWLLADRMLIGRCHLGTMFMPLQNVISLQVINPSPDASGRVEPFADEQSIASTSNTKTIASAMIRNKFDEHQSKRKTSIANHISEKTSDQTQNQKNSEKSTSPTQQSLSSMKVTNINGNSYLSKSGNSSTKQSF